MLYWLLYPLKEYFFAFNLFRYITFRAAYASVTALVLSFLLGPWLIRKLKQSGIGQKVGEDLPSKHREKEGVPTMGGILILIGIVVPTLLWSRLDVGFVWVAILATVWMGIIGFVDDITKLRSKKGMGAKAKFLAQLSAGLLLGVYLYLRPCAPEFATRTSILFFKNTFPDLRIFYIPFVALVLAGTSNAVNLTDGLDGLAVGLMGIAASAYSVLSYVTGHVKISEYLNILFMNGAGELSVFCTSMLGACLGFLWFNAHPAKIFLGDMGSLALGGALGIVAILTKQEILLLIVCGFFVVEALSVILQVLYFKLTRGKRLFLMSPIHHHFELKGWAESTIVVRFWIIGLLFALLALSTLKIR